MIGYHLSMCVWRQAYYPNQSMQQKEVDGQYLQITS